MRERGSIVLTKIKVWCAGFRDGWTQPYDLASSTNVDVYDDITTDEQWLDLQETLDYGINWGQTLRGGARSQADQEGYVPYGLRLRLASGAVLLATAYPMGVAVANGTVHGVPLALAVAAVFGIVTGGRPRRVRA